ncbi:hypothetical protein G6F22_021653 [Rhizopus arrhizus]|nr:hypothetical protein G6F22_021653 [Rhizopus arrhizus]
MAASAELMTNTATATALALMPIRLARPVKHDHQDERGAEHQDLLGTHAGAEDRDAAFPQRRRPRARGRAPAQQRQVLDDDAKADGAHHP